MTDFSPHAEWIETNGQKYLEVIAPDHYTLGKLEGKYLASKIKGFKKIIQSFAFLYIWRGMTYRRFLEYARYSLKPMKDWMERYEGFSNLMDEMQGMADAIPKISFDDILLQNYFIELTYGTLIPTFRYSVPETFEVGCTSLGSFDHGGKPIMGQNFDFNPLTQACSSFVHHKLPNTPEIFSFRLGGMLSLPACKTSDGRMMNVTVVKTKFPSKPIVGTGIRTRWGLENLHKARDMYELLNKEDDSIGYNLLLSDERDLIGLQITGYGIVKEDVDDFVVRSNTFLEPNLQHYLFKKNYSKERQQLATDLLREAYIKEKEGVTEEQILEILCHQPEICRIKTTAYITSHYFGIGRPCKEEYGRIPF